MRTVLDPTGERRPATRELLPRPGTLRGRTVGLLALPVGELVRGAGGMAEGVPPGLEAEVLPKFRRGGLLLVSAGGDAGMFSAIVGGWVAGETGSVPVTRGVHA